MCAAAVGTETDGSIVCPAGNNGIVGLKPTIGLISQAGIVLIAHSTGLRRADDRTVRRHRDHAQRDALPVRAGSRPIAAGRLHRLPESDALAGTPHRRSNGGSSCRNTSPSSRSTRWSREAITAMADAGAEIVDPVDTGDNVRVVRRRVPRPDVRVQGRHRRLPVRPAAYRRDTRMRTLADLIEFNQRSLRERR